MFKLIFYVPIADAEQVKQALFEAGAGKIGNYENCSFETSGIGQFLPINGAKPALGEVGKLERISELKVEMICIPEKIQFVIKVLKETHPYEEPAYEVIKLENF
jgi:hypothetical protein